LVLCNDTILALQCRPGAIHPISLNFQVGCRSNSKPSGVRQLQNHPKTGFSGRAFRYFGQPI
jgi:hypothetical protein